MALPHASPLPLEGLSSSSISLAAEGCSTQLRSKCLLQRTVLLLQQHQHSRALESACEAFNIIPESKHASALLATAQHKAGKKKQAAATVLGLCAALQRSDDSQMDEELGYGFAYHVRKLSRKLSEATSSFSTCLPFPSMVHRSGNRLS